MIGLPTYRSTPRRDRARCRLVMLALGVLALGLQLFAQVMPAQAMTAAMRASAAGAEEIQSFAATCLGFMTAPKGAPGRMDEKPAGQHLSCPVCFTLAQGQGFAGTGPDIAVPADWPAPAPQPVGLLGPAKEQLPPAFQSQAPPALAVL